MKRLDNKVAIVTGASKGIGAGIARAFGAEGAAVIVNYAHDQAGAERVVREITGKGGRAIAVHALEVNVLPGPPWAQARRSRT